MGVISFRSPQEGLEQYQKALEMMLLIKDIAHNPEVHATVAKLSVRLSDAQELSEAKLKAARDAEEIILQSKEHVEEFTKKQAEHAQEVNNNRREIEIGRKRLEADQQTHLTEKAAFQDTMRKQLSVADDRLAKAVNVSSEAALRNTTAERLEKEVSAKLAYHKENVKAFEEAQKLAEEEFNSKLVAHQQNIKKLAEEKAAFELRKKRFDDALKE